MWHQCDLCSSERETCLSSFSGFSQGMGWSEGCCSNYEYRMKTIDLQSNQTPANNLSTRAERSLVLFLPKGNGFWFIVFRKTGKH